MQNRSNDGDQNGWIEIAFITRPSLFGYEYMKLQWRIHASKVSGPPQSGQPLRCTLFCEGQKAAFKGKIGSECGKLIKTKNEQKQMPKKQSNMQQT